MLTKSNTPWRVHSDELAWQAIPESRSQQQSLPDHVGDCHTRFFRLASGLNYIETRYRPNCNVTVTNCMPPQEPRMVLTVGLSGHSRFQANRQDAIAFKGGYSTITTFNASEGDRHYQADQTVTQLRFSMTQSWLADSFGEDAFERFFANPDLQLIRHQPCASSSILAGQSLLQTTLPLQAQSLFRQGQAMTIIASELGQLLHGNPSSIRFTAHDKRIAERARDILAADLKNPPSVEALSKQAGSNGFKLKQLFHHYFDTTPYGLLLDLRMQKAHQLLASGQYPVSIVAETVGYRHASNFSNAFIKYFGFSPKQLRNM
ncbi:MAG: AraC family transcriptional regulator [Methylomonas sp.]|nr:MAG: AraC family transcriptional regulator [Methylomonas sp.]